MSTRNMIRSRPFLLTLFILLIFAAISGSILLDGCKNHSASSTYTLTGDTILDGENLVQIHCTKCHKLVPVNALTKDVWKFHTLPAMSRFLGLTSYLGGYYKKDTSGLSLLEWQNIVSYYQKLAPDTLPGAKTSIKAVNDWAGFSLKLPPVTDKVVYTTLAAINPYNHKIYAADGVSGVLKEWDSSLKMMRAVNLPSPAVSASFMKSANGGVSGLFSCIGQLEAVDFPNGKVVGFNFDDPHLKSNVFASELQRPVQTITADFNKDGLPDYIVCGQGAHKGSVDLFKQNTDHSFGQVSISEKPGAVKAVTGDFNKDGWPDVAVLFGRGDEALIMFLNDQHGGFTQRTLLSFPPVYSSTDFELTDLDHDGNPDLIYTCGYNFNDSRILKPYHGIYIYKNTGNFNFKQQWFYPVNGCTKLVTADFDGDGDLDIATTAFFADLKNNPAEGCIYFEQDKPFSFKPHTIPVSKYGRWFNMDVGDYNNDGKPDIVLANYASGFNFQPGLKQFWNKNLPFIVLQNDFKK
jgi:hypothetical protein